MPQPHNEPIEESWLATIRKWAQSEPRVAEVYLFGSRARGVHRPDSDLDLAVVLTEDESDTALGYAICEGDRLTSTLAAMLPIPIDLEFAFPDDAVVWPAVQDHGKLLFQSASSG